jgi:hypothetical protein
MAATELSGLRAPRRQLFPVAFGKTWLYAYAGVWSITLTTTAVVGVVGRPLAVPVRRVLGLTLSGQHNPPPQLGHILALAAHNIPIASWPLLLGVLEAHRHRLGKSVADGLVLVCIVANALPVGAAFGAYGAELVPFVPQLPLEWGGLALGASAWLIQRRKPLPGLQRVLLLSLIALLMLCSAVIETYAVPQR